MKILFLLTLIILSGVISVNEIFAQYMGNVGSQGEAGGYTLEEALEIQRNKITASNYNIPSWVKNNAGWWSNGQIDDKTFVSGMKFLINEGTLKIPQTTPGTGTGSNNIPSWVKNNAGWWANGQIDDNSFVQGIQYLIKEGILKVSNDENEKTDLENKYLPNEREWITSGPFQIDRSKYAIGEKIFLVMSGLNENEKGQIAFMRPLNDTHYSVYITIPFDGSEKNEFNYYVEPQISKTKEICSVDDLTGKWAVVFRETNYSNLYFEITNTIIPGTNTEPAC